MGDMLGVDQNVIFFWAPNDMKLVNRNKLDCLSSVHNGLIAIT